MLFYWQINFFVLIAIDLKVITNEDLYPIASLRISSISILNLKISDFFMAVGGKFQRNLYVILSKYSQY